MRNTSRQLVLIAAVALLFAPLAAGREAWDQATVTQLASELSKAARALKNTVRREPAIMDAASMGDRNAVSFFEAIDGLDRGARQLSSRTGNGDGYEQTFSIAQKIRSLVRDAEVHGARLMSSAFMDEKIAPVEALLGRLEPYYFSPAS